MANQDGLAAIRSLALEWLAASDEATRLWDETNELARLHTNARAKVEDVAAGLVAALIADGKLGNNIIHADGRTLCADTDGCGVWLYSEGCVIDLDAEEEDADTKGGGIVGV